MPALGNTPNSSYVTHALGVNVRKSGILWATMVYQTRFNQNRLAIDMSYFLIFYSGKRLAECFKLPLFEYHGATVAFQTPSDIELVIAY